MKSMEEVSEEGTGFIREDWDRLITSLEEKRDKGVPVTEGLFSALLGGTAGVTFGPAVMKAVCEALDVDVHGALGSLMTSRLILTAVGAKIGWRV